MAKKNPIQVTPLGADPDPLGQAEEDNGGGDLLGKIFSRQREARINAAQTLNPSHPDDNLLQTEDTHSLAEQEAKPNALQEEIADAIPDVISSAADPHGLPKLAVDEIEAQETKPRSLESSHARLQESKIARNLAGENARNLAGENARKQESEDVGFTVLVRAEEMGNSPLRDVGSRLPVDLDRWLERAAYEYEETYGKKMSKQQLLKLAVQRLYVASQVLGRLPELDD